MGKVGTRWRGGAAAGGAAEHHPASRRRQGGAGVGLGARQTARVAKPAHRSLRPFPALAPDNRRAAARTLCAAACALTAQMVPWVFHPLPKSAPLANFRVPTRQVRHGRTLDVVEVPAMGVNADRNVAHAEVVPGDGTRASELGVDDAEGRDQVVASALKFAVIALLRR